MTEFEKEEFWKGLQRLYDSTLNLKEATARNEAAIEKNLATIEKLLQVVESHERRINRLEEKRDSL